jgi:hypothetical protein
MWSPKREINLIKESLKKDYLYSDDEIRRLKRRLKDLRAINYDMHRGNGFGNGGAPVIDMTTQGMQSQANEAVETLNQLDRTAF